MGWLGNYLFLLVFGRIEFQLFVQVLTSLLQFCPCFGSEGRSDFCVNQVNKSEDRLDERDSIGGMRGRGA